jgi:hypothetical protein
VKPQPDKPAFKMRIKTMNISIWKDKISTQVSHLRQMNLVLKFLAKTETARMNCLLYSRISFVKTGFSIGNRIFYNKFWVVLENQHNPIWKESLSAIKVASLQALACVMHWAFATLINRILMFIYYRKSKKPTINDK